MTCDKCHHVHHGDPVCAFQIAPGRYCKCRRASSSAPRLTAGDLVRLIRARHETSAGWSVFEQAPNGTGYHASRFCDVLVLQTWPSRGMAAHGYEVKVDRRDLIRELREPKKADAFQRWCDRWWIAIPDAAMLEGLALPETWGVMVVKKGKLAVHRDAPALTPEPWGKPFVAALARGLVDGLVPKRELDEARQQTAVALEDRVREAVARDRLQRGGAAAALETLQERVAAFEERSGISLNNTWPEARHLGAAVALVQRLITPDGAAYGLEDVLRSLKRAGDDLRALDAAVREVLTPPAAAGASS